MIYKIIFFLLITFNNIIISYSDYKSIQSSNELLPKISVIVPCYYEHFNYLFELIEDYCHQTVRPDEIIISLSEADKVDQSELLKITNHNWPFPVILITTNEKLFAGENRNIAANNSHGDILVCQDADDKPHKQRIEIIKSIFAKQEIDHLMHGYTRLAGDLDFDFNSKTQILNKRFRLTPGNIAIKKKVFTKIKWSKLPRGQDCKFNRDVQKEGFKCTKMFLPLLLYRKNLSSKHSKSLVTLPKN